MDDFAQEFTSWREGCRNTHEVFPPSEDNDSVLSYLGVSKNCPLGYVGFMTGGIMIQNWIRIYGSGCEKMPRNLKNWNEGKENRAFYIADDVIGGIFALNGGFFGENIGDVYYKSPDSLDWESLDMGYGRFLWWAFNGDVDMFYQDLRWSGWQEDVKNFPTDHYFFFYPFLWTKEGSVNNRSTIKIDY